MTHQIGNLTQFVDQKNISSNFQASSSNKKKSGPTCTEPRDTVSMKLLRVGISEMPVFKNFETDNKLHIKL